MDGTSSAARLRLAADAAQSADWPTAQGEAARRQPELHNENPDDPGEDDRMPIAATIRLGPAGIRVPGRPAGDRPDALGGVEHGPPNPRRAAAAAAAAAAAQLVPLRYGAP